MKAIVQEKYGAQEEVLAAREIDKPVPGDSEVFVTGVGFASLQVGHALQRVIVVG